MSSNTCCTTPRPELDEPPRPCAESSARMTPCTRASCDGASSHVPLGPGAIGGADPPRPSQMHRRSFPGMIWHSRPVSMWRTSMKRESKMRTYGGCQATCSAVPSHSMVPLVRLGSPCRFTYNPNSVKDGQGTLEGAAELNITIVAKEEFVFARAEHPHWTTRFTTLGKFLMARIVTLRDRDTLEAAHPTCQTSKTR
jgi:hypothetical protein